MSAFVVVVSYNNLELTKRAVESLQAQTYPTRVAVWDNASTDGTAEWLWEQQGEFDWTVSGENVLWTPAVNGGMEKWWRGEEFVGYMNNDAAPLRHTVERMVELLQRPEVGLVAPSMERIGGPQDIANCEGHDIVRQGGFVETNIAHLPPKRVNFVMGAFAMLRKEVWDAVGPLAEDMPLGADDHDYAIRLKEMDYQIWVAQNTFCRHGGHASARTGKAAEIAWKDWGAKSWAAFNEKWAGYYATEEEATKCHWAGDFHEGWVKGTGWTQS